MTDERPTGMLTKTQREFLRGEKEYTGKNAKQQRYQRRQAIKDRVHGTMLDFALLLETWDDRGSGDLFGKKPSSGDVGKGISALLALLYSETYQHGQFKNLLLRGVNQGEERAHPNDEVYVRTNFDVEHVPRTDVDDAINRYRKRGNLNDMSDTELAVIAKLLRREKGVEAAKEAAKAWGAKQERIDSAFDDKEE